MLGFAEKWIIYGNKITEQLNQTQGTFGYFDQMPYLCKHLMITEYGLFQCYGMQFYL